MCRELARVVGELRRTIGDAFSPYRPELHYMRGPGPKCRVKRDARAATTAQPALLADGPTIDTCHIRSQAEDFFREIPALNDFKGVP